MAIVALITGGLVYVAACLVGAVVLSTGRGDIVVVIVWGAGLGGGEVNGRWCAGAVVALSTGR